MKRLTNPSENQPYLIDKARMRPERLAGIFLLLISTGAHAQETGTLLTHRPASVQGSTKNDARRTMREFGVCSVSKGAASAEKFVSLNVDSPMFQRLLPSVAGPDCLGDGELQIPRPVMRGSLFEALYVRRFHRSGSESFARVAPIDYSSGYQKPYSRDVANVIGLGQLGDCVTRADGRDAKDLILSIPATPLEDKAITGLASYLGPCVVKGETITFNRTTIRTAVAEGLYRLTVASEAKP